MVMMYLPCSMGEKEKLPDEKVKPFSLGKVAQIESLTINNPFGYLSRSRNQEIGMGCMSAGVEENITAEAKERFGVRNWLVRAWPRRFEREY